MCYGEKTMQVEMFPDGLEPRDQEARIWRFMEPWKFRDLVATGELYFCRADEFDDEGLPPAEYVRHLMGLSVFDLRDELELTHQFGVLAQDREWCFINCWYLFASEPGAMWQKYAKDGVAVVSRYGLLKTALGSCGGRPFLGLVRYGSKHLTGFNVLRFISTKQECYADEHEVRALLWLPDQLAGLNRHFDENNFPHPRPLSEPPDRVPKCLRRRVDLSALVTEIVVSPWATETRLSDVRGLVHDSGYSIPVHASDLTRYKDLLP